MIFKLVHQQARHNALEAVKNAPEGYVVTVKLPTRSSSQNAKLHALINEVADQCEWAGKKWDADVWKRLLVAAWLRTQNESPMLIPSLDGHGFDMVFEKTSKLSSAQCSDLIEYVSAFVADKG